MMSWTHGWVLRLWTLSLRTPRSSLSENRSTLCFIFQSVKHCCVDITFIHIALKIIKQGHVAAEHKAPGVLLAGAASAVQRDHFISTDAGLTNRTHLSARPGFQPLRTHRDTRSGDSSSGHMTTSAYRTLT